jgi:hypothetical protein
MALRAASDAAKRTAHPGAGSQTIKDQLLQTCGDSAATLIHSHGSGGSMKVNQIQVRDEPF